LLGTSLWELVTREFEMEVEKVKGGFFEDNSESDLQAAP